jgi:hypothetical protein
MTFKSIVTKSLICSAVALATVGSASANYRNTYRAAGDQIQDRYCLQGTDFGYPGSCQFSTYDQCMASASGRAASCGINPADGYAHQQREWILNYGGARHF